uniref:Uncharacterized protein n=1 Tax=Oryza brachyantha TaxID=4533 RepID=J3LB08_ORYBR
MARSLWLVFGVWCCGESPGDQDHFFIHFSMVNEYEWQACSHEHFGCCYAIMAWRHFVQNGVLRMSVIQDANLLILHQRRIAAGKNALQCQLIQNVYQNGPVEVVFTVYEVAYAEGKNVLVS